MGHAMPRGMAMSAANPQLKKKKTSTRSPAKDQSMDHGSMSMSGHDAMSGHDGMSMHGMKMTGYLGPYMMTREASGTSWQPDTSPHEGLHQQLADWSVMTHGWINLNVDRQDGPRGADKTFVSGMLMTMAQRPLGDGTLGVRAMLSPEPLMGANGYPLLLATGETADGINHLVDRQHPHDLFMELAGDLQHDFVQNDERVRLWRPAGRARAGGRLPSCIAPPAWTTRKRRSAITGWIRRHITFGVVTTGVIVNDWKVETSAFRRGPRTRSVSLRHRAASLDSFAGRVSWNPVRELSMQVSYGHLTSLSNCRPSSTRIASPHRRSTPRRSAKAICGAPRRRGDAR